MSTTTTQASVEALGNGPPQAELVMHLSELAMSAGYPSIPEKHIVALAELVSDQSFNEDEPLFALKVGITEAFSNLVAGQPVEQEHLVLAGLGYIVGSRRGEEAPEMLTIRAKAMANLILSHEAGAKVDLAMALPRVVGIAEVQFV